MSKEKQYNILVGQKIRAARLSAGLSQHELGTPIECSFQQIQKYENGDNRITPYRLSTIARITGKSIIYFFDEIPLPDGFGNLKTKAANNLFEKISKLQPKTRKALLNFLEHLENDE